MNYGLYTIFLGMRSRQNTLEVQANNLANASTAGFRAERLIYSSIEAENRADSDTQRLVEGVTTSSSTDFSRGTIQQTGRSMDIAIDGDGFIQIQTPRGLRYTRAGNFTVNTLGQISTKNGDLVVGENGPLTVSTKGELSIGKDGSLSVAGKPSGALKLVKFTNPATALVKDGDTLFKASGTEAPQPATDSKVVQGALESSNVNTMNELVAMINNNREFDSLQKSATLLMNDIGRKISGEIGKI